MKYNIPDDLAPYLEYIPDEMLSDIITDALRAAIFKSPKQPVVSQDQSIVQILEKLTQLSGDSGKQFSVITKELDKPKEKDKPIIISTTSTEDVDDDLKDLVSDFVGDMFK